MSTPRAKLRKENKDDLIHRINRLEQENEFCHKMIVEMAAAFREFEAKVYGKEGKREEG